MSLCISTLPRAIHALQVLPILQLHDRRCTVLRAKLSIEARLEEPWQACQSQKLNEWLAPRLA